MVSEKSLANLRHFQKGVHTGGRKPGTVSIVAALKRRLEKNPELIEELVDSWLKNSRDNPVLMKELIERLDGKMPQALTGLSGGPVEVIVRWDGNASGSGGSSQAA